MEAATAATSKLKGPWLIGGDFNVTPEVMEKSGWLGMIGGVIVAPVDPTCNKSVYDYFIVSKSLYDSQAIVGIVRMTDGGFHPHHPVRLILRGDSKRKMVRELVRPTKISGTLPHGPLQKERTVEQDTLCPAASCSERLGRWYMSARATLRSLVADGKPNKLQEAQVKWKPAIDRPAEQEAGATWKSETWRTLARRFTEVANLTHRSTAGSEAIIDMHIGKAWNRVTSAKKEQDEKLLMEAWVDAAAAARHSAQDTMVLVMVADRYAEKAESEARIADAKEWKKWACGDQRCKSGRKMPSKSAFQWVRSPSGWIMPTWVTSPTKRLSPMS